MWSVVMGCLEYPTRTHRHTYTHTQTQTHAHAHTHTLADHTLHWVKISLPFRLGPVVISHIAMTSLLCGSDFMVLQPSGFVSFLPPPFFPPIQTRQTAAGPGNKENK